MIHIIERNPLGCFEKQFCSKTLTSFSGCFTLLESKESASAFSSCSFDNFPALNSLIVTHHYLESQRCHSAAQTRAMVRLTMFTSSDRQTPPFTNQWQQLYITRRLFFFLFKAREKEWFQCSWTRLRRTRSLLLRGLAAAGLKLVKTQHVVSRCYSSCVFSLCPQLNWENDSLLL